MSLGVVVKGTEGVVLAADSRVTLGARRSDGTELPINYDNATKLLRFGGDKNKWVGAVTYGEAVLGTNPNDIRTAHSFIPEFEASLANSRLSVEGFATEFSEFFLARHEVLEFQLLNCMQQNFQNLWATPFVD